MFNCKLYSNIRKIRNTEFTFSRAALTERERELKGGREREKIRLVILKLQLRVMEELSSSERGPADGRKVHPYPPTTHAPSLR